MDIFVRTFGPGYDILAYQDECGCTVHLRITPFEGLEKFVDDEGQTRLVFIGDLGQPIVLESYAPSYDGRNDPLGTWALEKAHVEVAELDDWLENLLKWHHRRSIPRDVVDTADGNSMLATKVAEVKSELLQSIRRGYAPVYVDLFPGTTIILLG